MDHIAIDLGSRQSQICSRSPSGTIVWEERVDTDALPALLQDWSKSRIILETSSEAMKIGDAAVEAGHDLRLVPATLARTLGVGARRVKTDIRDAQALSRASCLVDLPSIHLRSERSRRRLQQLGARSSMVRARTQLINTARGWLRTQLLKVRSAPERFPTNVREQLRAQGVEAPPFLEQLLNSINGLNEQIKAAQTLIEEEARNDPDCQRLMTVPGIGPVTSLCFAAVVDDVDRFAKAHALESYFGLTPGEKSSSDSVRRTGITKAGPAMIRHYLTQASLTLRRLRPGEPISCWAQEIAERRGKHVATIAVARKLAGILYAMLRDKAKYQPSRASVIRVVKELPAAKVKRLLREAGNKS